MHSMLFVKNARTAISYGYICSLLDTKYFALRIGFYLKVTSVDIETSQRLLKAREGLSQIACALEDKHRDGNNADKLVFAFRSVSTCES